MKTHARGNYLLRRSSVAKPRTTAFCFWESFFGSANAPVFATTIYRQYTWLFGIAVDILVRKAIIYISYA